MTSIKRKCRTCTHCDVNNLICRPGSKDCRSEYALDIHDLDTAKPCDFYEESESKRYMELAKSFTQGLRAGLTESEVEE